MDTLATWHAVVQQRDMALLATLLAHDVVFHSPVVHTPQHGKAITLLYLQGAMQVLNTPQFHYVREIAGERDALLEFVTQIDGLHVNGVDLIHWNEAGLIDDFKVMVRPLKAINALHQKMGELLQRLSAPPATGATP
jgi:SnoaL-like domain